MTAVISSGEAFGRKKRRPLQKGPLAVSATAHVAVLAVLFGVIPALQEPVHIYETVDIDMTAMAPEPVEDLIVETPDDPPPAPEPDAPAIDPEPEPEPEPDTLDTPAPEEEAPPPAEPERPAATEAPDDGEDEITRNVETFRRDYPGYFENITNQIHRCFRWEDSGRLEVVMTFRILRDGSVPDFEVSESSGDHAFDLAAMAAIECAGRPSRMGPLPEDYPFEFLPVRFTITSRIGSEMSCPPYVMEGVH